ncbi:MAG: phosphoribosylanthranilate isomerase [Christensenellaceae bacterium]|jgi:phosphoribosylanthranilate isomerase|nr:phosphoribosylanthranilate isomerase [Christensenellaceae bacterium]
MRIKICGLFREEDICYANEARPDYIGFVFAQSRRRVTQTQAARLREGLDAGISPVGVFQNAPIEAIAGLYRARVIELAQLHGAEDRAYIQGLRAACEIPIIKAVLPRKPGDLEAAEALGADFLLLDGGRGGGLAFDWSLIDRPKTPFFLAGGIGLHNIEEAIEKGPFALDLSSGAERDGVKNPELMRALVCAVRERGNER